MIVRQSVKPAALYILYICILYMPYIIYSICVILCLTVVRGEVIGFGRDSFGTTKTRVVVTYNNMLCVISILYRRGIIRVYILIN